MGTIKSIIKYIFKKVTGVFFKIRASWPVWFYIINRKPRNLFNAHKPQLDDIQKRIIKDLNEKGIAFAHIDELFPGKNYLAELQKYFSEARDRAEQKTNKGFLRYIWDVSPEINFSNPFVKLSLQNKVVDTINAYLEMWSNFYYLTLNITVPVGTDSKAISSQRWHRDPEDKKMCKMFLYLNDVDESAGPFIYIPESKYGLKWGHLFKQQPPRGFYPSDGDVENAIPKEAVKKCVGRAGTVIFCDTSGLHKGGYAISKERVMFTAGYRSKASPWLSRFTFASDFKNQLDGAGASDAVRFAVQYNNNPVASYLLYFFKKNRVDKMMQIQMGGMNDGGGVSNKSYEAQDQEDQ